MRWHVYSVQTISTIKSFMEKPLLPATVQLWGGLECTINRVGDNYFDQLQYSGHYSRENDINDFASLGIKALRYPVLWEHHEPSKGKFINFEHSQKRLNKIRDCGITPIVGLIHHGSGPSFTNLLKPGFAEGLASYAAKVASNFPWVEYYTPVNEPLTTARFSGLYGLWYPHRHSDVSFAKMLLNQLKGVVLAMKEIRSVNPAAKLIQTEDLGKTYSTPALAFQAKFENERRWVSFDILCGRLKPGCVMYDHFVRLGIKEKELQFFIDNPCPPDILGLNYYITSERFLDENLQNYPPNLHGGNELQEYADIEAIRVSHGEQWGLKLLLREAWDRYQIPLAVTESHLNCTRDEQLRWVTECWQAANELLTEGVNIRAITAWALLGSFGWDSLLASPQKNYESGVFDIRSGVPRPTALASLLKSFATQSDIHPVCKHPGWWRRQYGSNPPSPSLKLPQFENCDRRDLLIIGKTGTLGNAFAHMCNIRHVEYYQASREDADITDAGQVDRLIGKLKPWGVINTAGFVRVDEAETRQKECFAQNATGPALLAAACRKYNSRFMTFSSDLVFDGSKQEPYIETDTLNPLNIYGRSKASAEELVQSIDPEALIIRTSAFFGPWDEYNFATAVTNVLSRNGIFKAAGDIFVSPSYLPDLVNYALDLLIDDEKGIWHLCNNGSLSWFQFAKEIAHRRGLDSSLIQEVSGTEMDWPAPRPAHSVLSSNRGILLPSLSNAMDRYITHCSHSPEILLPI